jgi:GAF domain-containing protein
MAKSQFAISISCNARRNSIAARFGNCYGGDMVQSLREPFSRCADLQSLANGILDLSVALTNADYGNVQLMNWKRGWLEIKAQRGFQDEFLNFFKWVKLDDGTACARAVQDRGAIIIEDVAADVQFSPYLQIARRAGFRAVQSTPLVSTSGALVGIVSTHFRRQHRPDPPQIVALNRMAQMAADRIIALRAHRVGAEIGHLCSIEECRKAIGVADKLLNGAGHKP